MIGNGVLATEGCMDAERIGRAASQQCDIVPRVQYATDHAADVYGVNAYHKVRLQAVPSRYCFQGSGGPGTFLGEVVQQSQGQSTNKEPRMSEGLTQAESCAGGWSSQAESLESFPEIQTQLLLVCGSPSVG